MRRESLLGPEHPDTLFTMEGLARVLDGQGNYQEAKSVLRQTLIGRERVLGIEHPDTLMIKKFLDATLAEEGNDEDTEQIPPENST